MSWLLVRAEYDPLPPDLSPMIETFRLFGVDNTLEDETGLQGCLVEVEGSDKVAEALQEALQAQGASSVTLSPYVEQNWEKVWRQFFKPRRVGTRFLIVPTWEEAEIKPDDVVLLLDPGQAFGTGDHPTTRMCLELMESLPLAGKTVADIGCGSGILAIGAAKLGARVTAVDIDPVALEVTRENADRNGVSLEAYCGDGLLKLEEEPGPAALKAVPQDETALIGEPTVDSTSVDGQKFDVAISNIISATLIRLAAQIDGVLNPGGTWIVSGIIEQNWPDVEAAVLALGLTLRSCLHEDGWVAAAFLKS